MHVLTLEDKINTVESILTAPDFRGTPRDLYHSRLIQKLRDRQEISGAELMVISLESLAPENPGISNIAGHHGGAVLPLYEHLARSSLIAGYIHVPHEQIAGHMAEGIASLGYVGVTIATSGPGATNKITAFYDAYMDSKPVVFITGNVHRASKGTQAFQEAPIKDMIDPVDKKAFYITNVADIPRIFYDAFATAISGRPGSVWIDVPKDVQLESVEPDKISYDFNIPISPNGNYQDIIEKLKILIEKIKHAKRPVLYLGGGAKFASKEINEFVRLTGIPVTTTLKGKGVYSELEELSLGMLGMHGTAYANLVVDRADLLINVGARFDDRVRGKTEEFAKEAYIVHIDIDPKGIGPIKNDIRHPDLTVKLDAKKAIGVLNLMVDGKPELTEWYNEIAQLKNRFPLDYDGRAQLHRRSKLERVVENISSKFPFRYLKRHDVIKPQYAIESIFELTKGRYIVVADVGQHQMWVAQYYLTSDPKGFDTSGGAGTMGYSLPAAFGVHNILKYQNSNKNVLVIVGDESFWQTMQTLKLYREHNVNVKFFVIDNKEKDGTPGGMVRQWYKRVHGNTRLNVRDEVLMKEVIRGFGIPVEEVRYVGRVEGAIRKALSSDGPYGVIFKVDPQEDCLPMIPGGGTVKQMTTYQSEKVDALNRIANSRKIDHADLLVGKP